MGGEIDFSDDMDENEARLPRCAGERECSECIEQKGRNGEERERGEVQVAVEADQRSIDSITQAE